MSTMYFASSSFVVAVLTLHSFMSGCSSMEMDHLPAQLSHRRLLQDNSNLAAADSANVPAPVSAPVPPSGSFPASGQGGNGPNDPSPTPYALSKSRGVLRSIWWLYMIVLPVLGLLLLVGIVCFLLPCRKTAAATIGPWRTGLSGQLQKAFVTGVPKLQRSELERACEEFSNIVASYPHYTVYKGTLSTGVEIAVVSTMITSSKEWSGHSESCFRNKIDSLSRMNHKNLINLLGYCEEEEPFTRMMVLEYAPNGTLYENLHADGFEHIDWKGRMRTIMGLAYCIQNMHELDPPLVHPDLQSTSILLSEDGAAKVADMSVWHEVISDSSKLPLNVDPVDHHEQVSSGQAGNVFSFGVLLLEIISGKLPYPEHDRSLISLAQECINSDKSIASLLDPTLDARAPQENELEVIREVIQGCIQSDPSSRPSMREVTARLGEAVGISPVAATPRLSPLWWAELEVLSSVEAG